ncbi:MAG: ATPase, T2SS/T4P/T4SS family, partial [Burkholderiaceae bacterium]
MIYVTVREPDGNSRQIEADQFPCRIGRHREAGVMLSSWRVARHHAQIRRDGRFFTLVDQGSLAGTWVNGTRIVEYSPLTDDDEILIAGYRLQLSGVSETEFTSSDTPVAANVATNMAANSSQVESGKSGESGKLSHFAAPAAPAAHAVPSLSSEASLRIATRHLVELRRHLHSRLLESMDLRRQEIRHLNPEHLRATARTHLERIVADNSEMWPDSLIDTVDIADNEVLIELVLDEAIGLGVLEQLLGGEDITEIMVNGCQPVYVEKQGRLQDTGLRFSSDDAILSVIERIVSPIGRRIDESSPMVDARLPDGSRVNAVIPPLAIEGPCITIRRFNTRRFDSSELVRLGSLSDDMLNFLAWCVERRLNVVVSGGTGSGKTT